MNAISMITTLETLTNLEQLCAARCGWSPWTRWQGTAHVAQFIQVHRRWLLHTQYAKACPEIMGAITKNGEIPAASPGLWGHYLTKAAVLLVVYRAIWTKACIYIVLLCILLVCKKARFDCLPHGSHLITVLDLLQRHVKDDRSKPVPITLSFGLHAMLMSLFVLQGCGDLARVAASAKKSYNTLFEQLQAISDQSKSPGNSSNFYERVQLFGGLAELTELVTANFEVNPRWVEMLTFWNPVMGGQYLVLVWFGFCNCWFVGSTEVRPSLV